MDGTVLSLSLEFIYFICNFFGFSELIVRKLKKNCNSRDSEFFCCLLKVLLLLSLVIIIITITIIIVKIIIT